MSTREGKEHDRGFSLIELLVAISLVSILSTLALLSYRGYNRSQDHRGSAREVVAILRNTQIRAVTEATTYQCVFTTMDLNIYRDSGFPPDPATKARATYSLSGRFSNNLHFVLSAPNGFTHPTAPLVRPNCLFYARGSATPGQIEVERIDRGTRHSIKLEGLTARVSYED